MGWEQFIIELWKPAASLLSAMAWPLALLIAVWWARPLLARLGDSLAQAIKDRDFRFKVGNVEAQIAAAVQQIPTDKAAPDAAVPSATAPAQDSEKKELDSKKTGIEAENIYPSDRPYISRLEREALASLGDSEAARLPTLLRWYADNRAAFTHEWIFNRIFASQISLLTTINQSGHKLPLSGVQNIYNLTSQAFPMAFPPDAMRKWMGFLVNTGLIYENNGELILTDVGHDFLAYIVKSGLNPTTRPL